MFTREYFMGGLIKVGILKPRKSKVVEEEDTTALKVYNAFHSILTIMNYNMPMTGSINLRLKLQGNINGVVDKNMSTIGTVKFIDNLNTSIEIIESNLKLMGYESTDKGAHDLKVSFSLTHERFSIEAGDIIKYYRQMSV